MTSATDKALTVHERCGVGPSDGGDGTLVSQTFPITFFDVLWLNFHAVERLLFYEFPCSTAHFLESVVPSLKKSLSQTLAHYLIAAAKLISPPDSGVPEFRYVPGDTVSLTVAEADESFDFNNLTAYGAREADIFYAFVPSLPETKIDSDSGLKTTSLLALQITLFPEVGICMGFTNHHAVGDANSIVGFIKAWSAISKLGDSVGGQSHEVLAKKGLVPLLDRSVIKDPLGLKEIFWNAIKDMSGNFNMPSDRPLGKVRQTFVLSKEDILKLKNLVSAKHSNQMHVSSFTVTAAYVWSCFVKSAAANGEEVDDTEAELFGIPVEARSRMDEPVPATYFGNCISFGLAESTHGELKGEEGAVNAAKAIGDLISNKINKKGEILRGADKWFTNYKPLRGKRITAVSGSPKFDLYEADFGWGMAKKYEAVTIDRGRSMSITKSREFEGGLEAAMTLSKNQMQAFAASFADGLQQLI